MNVFSVSQFLEFLNAALSSAVFPEGVAVEGEIAEYRVSQDKWIWFVLKDNQALVSCFATVWQLRTPLEDGMKVRVHGFPKVHPKSGKFSLTVERVELVGEGALRRAYELLKKKLAEEGLFAPERKRPIPRFPESVGLIASRESAAYSDFLRILGGRWGGLTVHSAHVQVQGRDAVGDILGAFRYFNAHPGLADVLVLTRGGGSLEDLQAFNSEEVARAVFSSAIPVVVGVGHERDETLADYAADLRASTPTHAAELIAPNRKEIAAGLESWRERLSGSIRNALVSRRAAVEVMANKLEMRARRGLDEFSRRVRDLRRHFAGYAARLEAEAAAQSGRSARLVSVVGFWAERFLSGLEAKERLLRGLDPRRLLQKGYALVRTEKGILKDAADVDIGAGLEVHLWKGALLAEVKKKM